MFVCALLQFALRKTQSIYNVGCALSHVLFSFQSSGYQLGCSVSAQRLAEHSKNALQNITTEGTPHSVLTQNLPNLLHIFQSLSMVRFNFIRSGPHRWHGEVLQVRLVAREVHRVASDALVVLVVVLQGLHSIETIQA